MCDDAMTNELVFPQPGRSSLQEARPQSRRRHNNRRISRGLPQGRPDNKISRNVRQGPLMTIERNANENQQQ